MLMRKILFNYDLKASGSISFFMCLYSVCVCVRVRACVCVYSHSWNCDGAFFRVNKCSYYIVCILIYKSFQ